MRHAHTANNKRSGAITIEYLIIILVIIGIGACFANFQGEIKNVVTTTQQATSNLVGNMLQGNATSNNSGNSGSASDSSQTHSHTWEAIDSGNNSGILTSLGGSSSNLHYCESCATYEEHNITEMNFSKVYYLLQENLSDYNPYDAWYEYAVECTDCGYWEIEGGVDSGDDDDD
jgi:hypothetical protein